MPTIPAIPLTQYDVLFAIGGAAVLFVIYKIVTVVGRIVVTRSSVIKFNPDQYANVLQNCYITFPIDNISHSGATFNRGMAVRITTVNQATVEGQFIGTNQTNMICVITEDSVIAQEIEAILEITEM